jgi:hypothetical protein
MNGVSMTHCGTDHCLDNKVNMSQIVSCHLRVFWTLYYCSPTGCVTMTVARVTKDIIIIIIIIPGFIFRSNRKLLKEPGVV